MSTFSWEFLCVNTKPLINSEKCRNEVADTKNQWVSEKDISNMAFWQNTFSWMFSWLFVLKFVFKNHIDLTIKKIMIAYFSWFAECYYSHIWSTRKCKGRKSKCVYSGECNFWLTIDLSALLLHSFGNGWSY